MPSHAGRAHDPPSNPFATRCTRPGAVPFLFPEGESLRGLIERLQANGWRGEIVGRHGSGKSALLSDLLNALADSGKRVAFFTLRDGQRRLPAGWQSLSQTADLVAIDGYEQLGLLARWRVRRFCKNGPRGLLVTSHATVGLPPLYRTQPTVELAKQVIRHLLAARQLDKRAMPSHTEVEQLFARHGGNLRELLFDLYDRYER